MQTFYKLTLSENEGILRQWELIRNDNQKPIRLKIIPLFHFNSFLIITRDYDFYYFDAVTLELLSSSKESKPFSYMKPIRGHLLAIRCAFHKYRKIYEESQNGINTDTFSLN